MSYTENLPEDEEFTSIADWQHYFEKLRSDFRSHVFLSPRENAIALISNKIFDACEFKEDWEFGLEFRGCYFKSEVLFEKGSFKGSISFKNCFFDKGLGFVGPCKFESLFEIVNGSVKSKILMLAGEFNEVRLSFIENPNIQISGGNYKVLNLGYYGNSSVEKLSIDASRTFGIINIGGATNRFGEISIAHASTDLSVSITDIRLNRLLIYQYRNDKSFRIANVIPVNTPYQSELTILETYMGKSEMYSTDLSAFSIININHTSLIDCSFVNMNWPDRVTSFKGSMVYKSKIDEQVEEQITKLDAANWINKLHLRYLQKRNGINNEILTYYRELKEVYRQLKFVHGKQGDTVMEQKFHSLEMQSFDKSISYKSNFSTKLIIGFSHWFSNYGTSLFRPLMGLLLGHWILLMVFILNCGIPAIEVSIHDASWEGFKSGVYWFLKLVNPLRKYDDNEIVKNSSILMALDFLMRIWASYMIYNFVRASRRFIK